MSPKPKRAGEPHTTSVPTRIAVIADESREDRDEKIRSRAYEIYVQRGQVSGYEINDWLQAEREIEDDVDESPAMLERVNRRPE